MNTIIVGGIILVVALIMYLLLSKSKSAATGTTGVPSLDASSITFPSTTSGPRPTSGVDCPRGSYIKDGICIKCPAGNISTVINSTSCTTCPTPSKPAPDQGGCYVVL